MSIRLYALLQFRIRATVLSSARISNLNAAVVHAMVANDR
jgi:hypothetical protein